MIDPKLIVEIAKRTLDYWTAQIEDVAFRSLASGKEIGHRIADLVDEKTTELLASHYPVKFECKPTGVRRSRSMGDVWLLSNGIYNPINVKAGEANKKGQPNMVSLKKLLRGLLTRRIDSYYLLIVKMVLSKQIGVSVYFVDILDYLNFMAFDSGPGQIMLREGQFYAAIAQGYQPPLLTMDQKIATLLGVLEEADQRLMENRAREWKKIQHMKEYYSKTTGHIVDQSGMHLT